MLDSKSNFLKEVNKRANAVNNSTEKTITKKYNFPQHSTFNLVLKCANSIKAQETIEYLNKNPFVTGLIVQGIEPSFNKEAVITNWLKQTYNDRVIHKDKLPEDND